MELRRKRVLAVIAEGEHLGSRAIGKRAGVSYRAVQDYLRWFKAHGYAVRVADDHTVGQRCNRRGRGRRTPRYVVTDAGRNWLGNLAPAWHREMDEATREYDRLVEKMAACEKRDRDRARRRRLAQLRERERAAAESASVAESLDAPVLQVNS